MAAKKRYIFTSDGVNSYGFRVLPGGIDWSQFIKNPVLLFNHIRCGDNYKGPVGKWVDLDLSGSAPSGVPDFDMNDEQGKALAAKDEGGYIGAASIGFEIIELSEDPAVMLPGQTLPTVTKCKVVEVSVVDIPADDNALALYNSNNERVELTRDGIKKLFSALPTTQLQNTKTNTMERNLVIATLGLKPDATDADIISAIQKLKNQAATDAETIANLQKEKGEVLDKAVETELSAAVNSGKITEADKATWKTLFNANFDGTKAALAGIKVTAAKPLERKLTNEIKPEGGTAANGDEPKTLTDYLRLGRMDDLNKLKREDRDAYIKIAAASGISEGDIDWNS